MNAGELNRIAIPGPGSPVVGVVCQSYWKELHNCPQGLKTVIFSKICTAEKNLYEDIG